MDKNIKIALTLIIIIVFLISLIFVFPKNSYFKDGDTVKINGEISEVNYMNTSYGKLPIIILEDHYNKFRNANLLDNNVYDIMEWPKVFDIYGEFDKTYSIGGEFEIILHFEEMQLNDAKFLWAKELGIYLELTSAITEALDYSANIAGFYLKWISSDNEGHSSYEVYTTNKDQFPLDLFNVSLKKNSYETEFQDNLPFSTLLNNTLNLLSSEYEFVTVIGEGFENIDFMSSLIDSVSQNGLIEFIDKNSNNLIDDYDVFKLSIPPTEDDTKLETYLLLIGVDDFGNFNNVASGAKYFINWYDGIYEQIIEKELIAINYTSHQQNGTLIDTTLKISRINSNADLSINNFRINFDNNNSHLAGNLIDGNIIEEENIKVDFIDSNKNGILDVDDLFYVNGLEYNSTSLLIITNQQYNMVAYFPWIVGEGYSRNI